MKNYMEKGVIPQMTTCKVLVLIPRTRKEMRMILVNVVMRLGRRKIMNDMKREMIKLKGVNMMMQNMVMV
jgi:hypothetical protein